MLFRSKIYNARNENANRTLAENVNINNIRVIGLPNEKMDQITLEYVNGKGFKVWAFDMETFESIKPNDFVLIIFYSNAFLGKLNFKYRDPLNKFRDEIGWTPPNYDYTKLTFFEKGILLNVGKDFRNNFVNNTSYTGEEELEKYKFLETYGFGEVLEPIYKAEQVSDSPIIKNKIDKKIITVKNQILFGPPGTGKTFSTKNKSISIISNKSMENTILSKEKKEQLDIDYERLYNEERIRFITFHPSYAYEDFMEGIRPEIKSDSNEIKFELKNGIFKNMCFKALKEFDEINLLKDWSDYKDSTMASLNQEVRAKLKDSNSDSINRYVLIIDEINRGDISKIFGELITLIEDDKRIGKDNQLIVQLPYSRDNFGIPPNLYIIGTMNTADRSLALLDIALRRRFEFEEMKPDFQILKKDNLNILGIEIDFDELDKSIKALENINIKLGENQDIGKDKKIGHAYLMNIKTNEQLMNVWKNKILPLLEEYYFFDKQSLVSLSNNNYEINSGWDNNIEKIISHFQQLTV